MSQGVELVLIIKQKIVVLLRVKSTMVERVLVVIRMIYNEPKFN
jgi:hypothetical protein